MRSHHYRYGIVLILILVSLAFQLAAPDGDGSRLVIVALQAATLVAAVIASQVHRWLVRLSIGAALALTAGAFAAVLGTDEVGQDSVRIIGLLFVTLAPPVILYGVVRDFRQEREVTMHTMFGVLCLYLLIGLFYASALEAIQSVSDEDLLAPHASGASDFLYFSYTTITTTGFGDLVASTRVARSLAVTEMLIGQIYLVSVVALIVSQLASGARARRA